MYIPIPLSNPRLVRAWINGLHSLAQWYSGTDELQYVDDFGNAVAAHCATRDCYVVGHSLGECMSVCVEHAQK